MSSALRELPDDVDALKALVHAQGAELVARAAELEHYRTRVESLQEQLRRLLAQRYSPSSERLETDNPQLRLFNEAEAHAEAAAADDVEDTECQG
jgi:transposase